MSIKTWSRAVVPRIGVASSGLPKAQNVGHLDCTKTCPGCSSRQDGMFNRWWLSKGFPFKIASSQSGKLPWILEVQGVFVGNYGKFSRLSAKTFHSIRLEVVCTFEMCVYVWHANGFLLRIHHSHQGKAVLLSKLVVVRSFGLTGTLKLTANSTWK